MEGVEAGRSVSRALVGSEDEALHFILLGNVELGLDPAQDMPKRATRHAAVEVVVVICVPLLEGDEVVSVEREMFVTGVVSLMYVQPWTGTVIDDWACVRVARRRAREGRWICISKVSVSFFCSVLCVGFFLGEFEAQWSLYFTI